MKMCSAVTVVTAILALAAAGSVQADDADSFSFCGLVMNNSKREFAFSTVNNVTGRTDRLVELPMLDEFGLGVSTGASHKGLYYTISGTWKEQEEILVVDVPANKAEYVKVKLPKSFDFFSVYGVAMLDVNEATGTLLAMVMGYSASGDRYCFLGDLDSRSGEITHVAYNLTLAYRQWVYLYSGVSAWDQHRGLYYLEAVEGARDLTSLYVVFFSLQCRWSFGVQSVNGKHLHLLLIL